MCTNGHSKSDHECRQNFCGSAKAMESDVGAALVNESSILKDIGLNVRVLIGDEDSSTIAAVRQGNLQTVFKLADSNHLKKNFANALYELRKGYSEMRNKEVIPHLKKCFSYALVQNKGHSAELGKTIRNIPEHVFGQHENCGVWCKGTHKIELKNQQLYTKLSELFGKYADNAAKFSVAASSQANESINNIMAHKAPKNCCYSLSESGDYRLASTVCTKNEGEKHIMDVNSKLNVSPGKHTASFAKVLDTKRKKRAMKAKLPTTKARRNLLARKKEASRKSMEQSEGIHYETNCGINSCSESRGTVDFRLLLDILPTIAVSVDSCNIIYFDLETSGFSKDSEILQIAAKFENSTFSVYLHPSKSIDADASRVTGLKYVGEKLYFYSKEVATIAPREALISFQQFLEFSSKPCVLVAHNASFDSSHLLRYIIDYGMIESFKNIAGFSDSLTVMKKVLPERKAEKKSFNLPILARDLLNFGTSDKFHEALFDVETLVKLCDTFAKKEMFLEVCKLYKEVIMVKLLSPSLKYLKGVISNQMILKIAGAGIHYEILKEVYAKDGDIGIKSLLSEKTISNKPRVTKAKKIIETVVEHLRNKG
ncbi:uncharacterized protein [Neodiprion pinetum]|uniref:uncharacterized protein n=1 Tax=Neodiprion pinetum TaxID=441929 RepID=UPI001EDF97F1|nr:uncharacterized protein LOC124211156 [Neodiprion pinetum]